MRNTLLDRLERAISGVRLTFARLALLLFCLSGCVPLGHTLAPVEKLDGSAARTASKVAMFTSDGQMLTDLQRLADLWHRRTKGGSISDYPIGPGDVLEISIPGMEELKDRVVRISGEGTITLPFTGTVRAGGLSEHELREEIRRRLANYMYNPQVNLFVRENRSQQVAVLGAVTRPGLYNLASEADTIFDSIALAGGMKEEAAQRILFIPAEPVANEKAREFASALPVQLTNQDPSLLILKQTDPISIDLENFTRGGHQIYLTLPVRPGDVILVPGSGEVLVQGWVAKPGSYKITPGLTVLGAVAAAGGPLFAADTSGVRVIRTAKEGGKTFLLTDLEQIKRGEQSDVPVQESDVIEVSASAPRLVPYGIYRFFTSIFSVGASVPVP